MALTAQQLADTRRWLGWPTLKNGEADYVYGHTPSSISLANALTNMTAIDEGILINTYLTNLSALETGLLATQGDMDTKKAGPWESNPREVSDRRGLFTGWRREMAAFLGFPTGPGISGGNYSATITRA